MDSTKLHTYAISDPTMSFSYTSLWSINNLCDPQRVELTTVVSLNGVDYDNPTNFQLVYDTSNEAEYPDLWSYYNDDPSEVFPPN